jgi:hypothetical protein
MKLPQWAYASSGSSPAVVHVSRLGWILGKRSCNSESLSLSAQLESVSISALSEGIQYTEAFIYMKRMKRFSLLAAILIMVASISALAAPKPTTATVPAFPGTLANARYVYVASYDGDQFDQNLLPDDREAIGAVQDAIQKWGKLTLVYRPSEADVIILVTSRPSEDVMAVFDGHGSGGNYLWRVMGRDGLQSGETPLVTQFEKGFDSVQKHK